jgi:predicted DNA-binding transcriptional regulator AlpA
MTQRDRLRVDHGATSVSGTSTAQLFLTAAEAAALLRVSAITLSRWRIQGYGPRWIKMGPKRVAYEMDDIIAWTNAQKRTSTSDQ